MHDWSGVDLGNSFEYALLQLFPRGYPHPAQKRPRHLPNKVSTKFSHDPCVGVCIIPPDLRMLAAHWRQVHRCVGNRRHPGFSSTETVKTSLRAAEPEEGCEKNRKKTLIRLDKQSGC